HLPHSKVTSVLWAVVSISFTVISKLPEEPGFPGRLAAKHTASSRNPRLTGLPANLLHSSARSEGTTNSASSATNPKCPPLARGAPPRNLIGGVLKRLATRRCRGRSYNSWGRPV